MAETLSPLAAADEDFIAIRRECDDLTAIIPQMLDLAAFLDPDWLEELMPKLTKDVLLRNDVWSGLMRNPAALAMLKCNDPAKTGKRLSEVIKAELKSFAGTLCQAAWKARARNAAGVDDISLAMEILDAAAEVKRHEGEHSLPRYLNPDHNEAVERAIAALERGDMNQAPMQLLSCIATLNRVYPKRAKRLLNDVWDTSIHNTIVDQGKMFKAGQRLRDEALLFLSMSYLTSLQKLARVDPDKAAGIVEPEDWILLGRILDYCRGRSDTSTMHRSQQLAFLNIMRELQPLFARFFPKP